MILECLLVQNFGQGPEVETPVFHSGALSDTGVESIAAVRNDMWSCSSG